METSLPPQSIGSALFTHWSHEIDGATPTIYPGVSADTTAWEAWYELWVDAWSPRPRRVRAPELSDVQVAVHAYVRTTTDQGRIAEMMAEAQRILTGRTLPIAAGPEDSRVVGYLKLGPAQVKELTRLEGAASRRGWQHHVALWRGIAQRVDVE